MADTASSRVRIGRFRLNCLVPKDHPSPERVRSQVAAIVEGAVPDALSAIFANALPDQDESVWFVRELQLEADLNVTCDTRDVARSLAGQTARALVGEMSAADGGNLVRFANPSEYLAAFLSELANGFAWERWYYRRFDGLRLLSPSAALRTAICNDPEIGLAALQHLSRHARTNVVRRLTPLDAKGILSRMQEGGRASGPPTRQWIESVFESLRALSFHEWTSEKAALLALIEMTRSKELDIESAAMWCAHLGSLVHLLHGAGADERAQLLHRLRNPQDVSFSQSGESMEKEALSFLLQFTEAQRLQIIEGLIGNPLNSPNAEDSLTPQTSAFGGAFFLLPLMDQLPLTSLFPEHVAAMLRWILLVKCFGPRRAFDASRDPLLRDLTGTDRLLPARLIAKQCEEQVPVLKLRKLLSEVRQPDQPKDREGDLEYFSAGQDFAFSPAFDRLLGALAQTVLGDFARRIPGFAWSSPVYLEENFLDCDATVEYTEDRCVVNLGRPPLNLILNVAGINRQRYRLSWRGGLRFELYSRTD